MTWLGLQHLDKVEHGPVFVPKLSVKMDVQEAGSDIQRRGSLEDTAIPELCDDGPEARIGKARIAPFSQGGDKLGLGIDWLLEPESLKQSHVPEYDSPQLNLLRIRGVVAHDK